MTRFMIIAAVCTTLLNAPFAHTSADTWDSRVATGKQDADVDEAKTKTAASPVLQSIDLPVGTKLVIDNESIPQDTSGSFVGESSIFTIIKKQEHIPVIMSRTFPSSGEPSSSTISFHVNEEGDCFVEDITADNIYTYGPFPTSPFQEGAQTLHEFIAGVIQQSLTARPKVKRFTRWNDSGLIRFEGGAAWPPQLVIPTDIDVNRIYNRPHVMFDRIEKTTTFYLHFQLKGMKDLLAFPLHRINHERTSVIPLQDRFYCDQDAFTRPVSEMTMDPWPSSQIDTLLDPQIGYTYKGSRRQASRQKHPYKELAHGEIDGFFTGIVPGQGYYAPQYSTYQKSPFVFVNDQGAFFLTSHRNVTLTNPGTVATAGRSTTATIVRKTSWPFIVDDRYKTDHAFSRGFYKPQATAATQSIWKNPHAPHVVKLEIKDATTGALLQENPFDKVDLTTGFLGDSVDLTDLANTLDSFLSGSSESFYIETLKLALTGQGDDQMQKASKRLWKLVRKLQPKKGYNSLNFDVDELNFADTHPVTNDLLRFLNAQKISKVKCGSYEISPTGCGASLRFLTGLDAHEPAQIIFQPGCDLSEVLARAAGLPSLSNLARFTNIVQGNKQLTKLVLSGVTFPTGHTAFADIKPFYQTLKELSSLTELFVDDYDATVVSDNETTQALLPKFRGLIDLNLSGHDFEGSLDLETALRSNNESLESLDLSHTKGISKELEYVMGNDMEGRCRVLNSLNSLKTLNLLNVDFYQPVLWRCLYYLPASLRTLKVTVKNSYGWDEDYLKLNYLEWSDANFGEHNRGSRTAKALGKSAFGVIAAAPQGIIDTLIIGSAKLISAAANRATGTRPDASTSRWYDWTLEALVENATVTNLTVQISDSLLNPQTEKAFLEQSFSQYRDKNSPINITVIQ